VATGRFEGCGLTWHLLSCDYCRLPDTADNCAHGSNTTPAQRKDHRAEAHHLNAVVMIGSDDRHNVKEIDAALVPMA
jgi:hypothetical protein